MTPRKKPTYAKLELKYQAAVAALAQCEAYRRKELAELNDRRVEMERFKKEVNQLSFENAKLSKPNPT